jgi:hypothetical protein
MVVYSQVGGERRVIPKEQMPGCDGLIDNDAYRCPSLKTCIGRMYVLIAVIVLVCQLRLSSLAHAGGIRDSQN